MLGIEQRIEVGRAVAHRRQFCERWSCFGGFVEQQVSAGRRCERVRIIAEAFVGDEKKFSEPVLVEINEFGVKKIGFLVQKDLTKIGLPGEVAVYFPWSYSFAGQVIIVSAGKVKPLDRSAADVMKFVISGGVSGLD